MVSSAWTSTRVRSGATKSTTVPWPMRERIRRVMAGVFHTEPTELPDDVSSEDLEEWDSLRHLELMLELELEFDIEIDSEAMAELLSRPAIEAYLKAEVGA